MSNVASTGEVTMTYDTSQTSATNGLLLSTSVGANYVESYSYNGNNQVAAVARTIDAKSYTTSYEYNQAPNWQNGNTGYLTNVTYNTVGQVTGLTLGNGVVESYGYDSQRLQLTSQTATKGATSLMNLSYSYQATAGQNGATSTAGNSGQLMNIAGTINSQTESAAYTYDNLGRLATSNQTTNGVSVQRRFVYDRWGNRTSEYDATSGGTQIQSVALQQSGGAPTNRLSSVTTGSTTLNYSYDAAGNVTNDGVHTYTYDAENRVVNVDGGATASYGYDQQNRRVKKVISSTTTHCVWDGGQVLAEHNGSTGAVITNYTYAGSRMINKMTGGTTSYFLSDRLSARLTLDSSGNVIGRQAHLPFGEDLNASGTTDKHKMTSYERETETGTDYAVNRSYSAGIGRFQSADPYRMRGGINDPQSLNRFSYTRNDPIDRIDPLGLSDIIITFPCEGSECSLPIVDFPVNGRPRPHIYTDGEPRPGDKGLSPINYDAIIAEAIALTILVLSEDNSCSRFFGGSGKALEVLDQFGPRIMAGFIDNQDTSTGIRMRVRASAS
ncbi:MAG: hypothetical protein HY231_17690 [Acidobacteria bacterium]|nr:hypothetical protein [Acidobacteriota bacterium]